MTPPSASAETRPSMRAASAEQTHITRRQQALSWPHPLPLPPPPMIALNYDRQQTCADKKKWPVESCGGGSSRGSSALALPNSVLLPAVFPLMAECLLITCQETPQKKVLLLLISCCCVTSGGEGKVVLIAVQRQSVVASGSRKEIGGKKGCRLRAKKASKVLMLVMSWHVTVDFMCHLQITWVDQKLNAVAISSSLFLPFFV